MNMKNLEALDVTRKIGSEQFFSELAPAGFNLISFWQWPSSDLMGNALRGVLAEYIVASAVGCSAGVRTE